MPCPISLDRMIWRLREAEPLTPAVAVEIIAEECRDALGGERLPPRAIDEAAGILRMGLAGLGIDRTEADTLTGRLRTILVS